MNAGFVVLSRDPLVRGEVMTAATRAGVAVTVAQGADELLPAADTARAIIVDRVACAPEHPGPDDILRQLAEAPERAAKLVLVIRSTAEDPPSGADVLVVEPALGALLAALAPSATPAPHPLALDRLVAISVLSGSLDEALEAAAAEVAASFGVDRCVITVRGDATGGTAGGSVLDGGGSPSWNQTSDLCRVAAAAGATLVAPSPLHAARTESYIAVPLVPSLVAAHGSHGFLGLVASGARIFGREHRTALQAIAARLGNELGWRAVQERTADELDRAMHGPGLDPQLGIWNRTAMTQLATMHVSASVRTQLPLTAAVVDVVDLGGINTRHGLDTGDRVLCRIADALRANLRTEDVVGRWSGDKLAVLLPGTAIDGAQRVAERFRAAVAERPLELPGGAALQIPATIGLAALALPEEAAMLLARAARAAKQARDADRPIARAPTGPTPRVTSQLIAPRGSAELIDLAEDVHATLGGTYRLLHEISRGGMGVVYRAEDLALERPVAIKMLRPDLAEDRAFVEHLRGEAAMLARLEHPNLVQIYNFGQSGGDSYFVMELVEGEGLQQAIERHRLERTQMPLPELVTAIEQVASALDALHERGVIHRDVKPANVIRDPFRGRSVLVDVGIARRFGQFAESAGTPGYVAPEVIEGLEAGPPSDVYGLAATTYTLLTLAAPWGDGDSVLQRQTAGEEVPPPSLLRAELAPIDDLLHRSLARDPRLRPATAGAFARELRAFQFQRSSHAGTVAAGTDI
ncbi:MAG TPA: diguanylate cyclase [Kofleriaceae bacterium]|nr:diguanylate cyclase [Kofleriaceae bacterium]